MNNISHEQIEKYLLYRNWSKTKEIENKASSWKISYRDGKSFILLPLDKEFADYQYRIEDILNTLCIVEDCSLEEIILSILLCSNNSKSDLELFYRQPYSNLYMESANISVELNKNDLYQLMKECFKLYRELFK